MTKAITKKSNKGISHFRGNKTKETPATNQTQTTELTGQVQTQSKKSKEPQATQEVSTEDQSKDESDASKLKEAELSVLRSFHPEFTSVDGHLVFKLADGRELRNLLDLAHSLESMSDEVFFHHVGQEHNHFSNWIKDCFKVEHLAESIKGAPKIDAQAKIFKHMMTELMK